MVSKAAAVVVVEIQEVVFAGRLSALAVMPPKKKESPMAAPDLQQQFSSVPQRLPSAHIAPPKAHDLIRLSSWRSPALQLTGCNRGGTHLTQQQPPHRTTAGLERARSSVALQLYIQLSH